MGEKLVLSAALKKGDQADSLVLANGVTWPLEVQLPQPAGTDMVVEVTNKAAYQIGQQALAKQLLQEILNGR